MADAGDSPNKDKPPEGEPPKLPPQQPRWSEPIFRAGLIVGSGLFVVGVVCEAFLLIAPTVSILIICSGLGIIFGAFGSTAVVSYKGIVVAGVAAVAVVLLLIVDYVMRETLVRLEVDGDVKGARVELFGDANYPGADHDGRFFEFFIVGREIRKDRLSLVITPPPPPRGTEPAPPDAPERVESPEVAFNCIPSTAITRYIGSGRTLQWRYDAENAELEDVDGKSIKAGPCQDDHGSGPGFVWEPSLVGAAMAQTEATTASVGSLLADLDSESTAVRRAARSGLAAMGEAAVRPMMAYWQQHPDSYRVRLGVSVALVEFLRGNKDKRRSVAALLTDPQLVSLAAAAVDPDRTLRIYAAEFLYDLGSPRIVGVADRLFPGASDDGRYNLVLIVRGAVPDLSPQERASLRTQLARWQTMGVGRKTQDLIARVMREAA